MSESESEDTELRPLRFVAVLLGDSHVRGEEESLEFAKKICEEIMLQTDKVQHLQACQKCEVSPKDDITAETAVIQLVKRMEDNPDLNCGLFSNLNMEGEVECDAGLMFSKTGIWTGVGAVPGCKNPILFAKSLYDHQGIPRPLGLAQPDLYIGAGAEEWMQEHCPHLFIPGKLISSRASSRYQKYKSNYDSALNKEVDGGHRKKQRREDEKVNLDTVGAIAVDRDYNFAAAVSSGGTLLRQKGNIGHAAVPGGGCWAHDNVAVVTTGVGENLIQRLTAKSVADSIEGARTIFDEISKDIIEDKVEDLYNTCNNWMQFPRRPGSNNPVGILAVNTFWGDSHFSEDKNPKLYFHYGHNTDTMCIGYMSSDDSTGHSMISRQESGRDAVKRFVKTMVFPAK